MNRGHPKLGEKERMQLIELVKAHPDLGNADLCRVFFRESGIRTHVRTLLRALRKDGIERVLCDAATGEVERHESAEQAAPLEEGKKRIRLFCNQGFDPLEGALPPQTPPAGE
jgi:hypothetical protein